MAFDITTGEATPAHVIVEYDSYDDFFDATVEQLSLAVSLVATDHRTADDAVKFAAVRSYQQWSRIRSASNPLGRALSYGVARIRERMESRPSAPVDGATGGYVRGLSLRDAIDALPVWQRATLVATYYLGWSDEMIADGFEVPVAAVERRRQRAEDFVRHHLQVDDDLEPAITRYFTERSHERSPAVPGRTSVTRSARRRTLRTRLVIAATALSALAVVGLLFNLSSQEASPAEDTPEEVDAPVTASDSFGPVGDDRGGFVSVRTQGPARFASSTDGTVWLRNAVWNSRAIDLRTEITRLVRSGDRYIATIEPAAVVADFVAPRVATSTDLARWDVRSVDIGQVDEIEGLRTKAEVLSVAATGDMVLVAIGTTEEIDYLSLGVQRSGVCAEVSLPAAREVYLCDGTTHRVEKPVVLGDETAQMNRLFLSEAGGRYIEVALPAGADPYGISSFDGGFAMVHGETGEILVSPDGRTWTVGFAPDEPNRLVLLTGSASGGALAVVPQVGGWIAALVEPGSETELVDLPIAVDPASVWTKPELAHGPAGWALFVTTSRPWERTDAIRGWAVDAGDWIVSRQPDSPVVTARAADGSRVYRYVESDMFARRGSNEQVTLFDPATGDVLVDVSQSMIDDSRATAISAETGVEAQVLFSPDGVAWRPIWQSSEDAWSGSIAVGDAEVLLTGARLLGGPLRLPLDEEAE